MPFLAFGNGAASYVDGRRFSRPRGLPEYGRWVDKLVDEGWESATATAAEGSEGGRGGGGGPSDEAIEKVRVCIGAGRRGGEGGRQSTSGVRGLFLCGGV